jgi:DNA repair photolyase
MPTLADLQRAPGAPAPAPEGLPLDVQRVRTFETPDFAGMRFLEVEAKTALNRVRGMPFAWSINPYRGCSHACAYCLAVDTPILMADGRSRRIGDVEVGDRIYGTRRDGPHRRCVATAVLDRWTSTKPAYRITLADGTVLVASADHRFLTERGWKHVTGAEQGRTRRPHLTLNDSLMGTTDPAMTRQRSLEGAAIEAHAALDIVAIEPLGIDVAMVDLSTGTGDFIANGVVSHNCFARPTHAYLNLSPLGDFERTVVVKTNVVEVLRRELARPSWRGESVALGTNTDPYQRCEGRYRLMPGVIDALAAALTPFSILTKGTLITRDVDRLVAASERVEVGAALTVGMLDEDLWRLSEPGTPPPRARLDAVRALNAAGIPTGVMLAPVMPHLNDDREQLAALVDACAEAGATHITPIVLHLRPGVRELFMPWLQAQRPDLVGRYEALYRGATAAKAYRDGVEAFVAERRRAAWRRLGRPPAGRARGGRAPAPTRATAPEQLQMW